MLNRKRQTGLTALSWLVVAVVAGILMIFLVKMGPVYLESLTVKSVLNQVAEEARGEDLSRAQIRQRLYKKLLINTVKGVKVQDISVTDADRMYTIDANYEVRKHLFLNIDMVAVFDDMIVTVNRI